MTIQKTARFAVDHQHLDRAIEAIAIFVAHTDQEPGTLIYASWQSASEPTRFLHLMQFADAAAEHAHATSEAVREFTAELYPLCTETPVFEDWHSHP